MSQQKARKRIALRQRSVALLIEFSRAYGRGVLSGIARFMREHHEWSVQSEEWRWTESIPAWLKDWKGDGVIAWVEKRELAATIRKLGVPAVDVRGSLSDSGLTIIDTDNEMVSALAAEHFIQRGFRRFAFCGFDGVNYSDNRCKWFQRRLGQIGFGCAVYQSPDLSGQERIKEREKRDWLFMSHLDSWLKSLPKPIGIMACNDIRGQQVMNGCRRVNLAVPEEVAVIGVDNDPIFCELSDPPLSSVEPNVSEIGYRAAALLEQMMSGQAPPLEPILIPPLGVVTRRSSDIFAIDDRQLAAGVRFLREHVFDFITTDDLARAAGMSRRVFERRFLALLGRPPKAEILRLRLSRAQELLAHTNWTLAKIAERTGFNYGEYLHAVFTQKLGLTPGEFRRKASLTKDKPLIFNGERV